MKLAGDDALDSFPPARLGQRAKEEPHKSPEPQPRVQCGREALNTAARTRETMTGG